ncbi:glycerol kinase GlpK [Candidatus Viridilinea mediisalina]|uniref:Glycerol kinase n=1 Tax=Candidatus Viridilinea mediisalina TaxID=2024553 RepID=A0A2A6RN90_9CHLR|nr:glycerol kinase GlpK [Candidatus Viridilinea mediisalina]PDW04339.1 glycerol kinase [Candidatus Viridilinea mediisalina]
MKRYVAAIDQGTTSTRCMLFDRLGGVVAADQREHRQIFPQPGWVEHDPEELWHATQAVVTGALARARLGPEDVAAVGLTNQRETTLLWDRKRGVPLHHALVWQDTRTAALCHQLMGAEGKDRFRAQTGLPIATYFSAPKLRWLLDTIPGAREAAEAGELAFGTIDTWLAWQLTGGVEGGLHITDVTNASRTLLMDLATEEWDDGLLAAFDLPRALLPTIMPSSWLYGECRTLLPGVPLAGILGDQHAATVGQACYQQGEAKNTYGTGNFMLLNTGSQPVPSQHGLITTPGYRFGTEATVWTLEGSIAVTGSLIQWLRDNLGIIRSAAESESLARQVSDNGGVYFVPAFSGLFAPYWRADARGVLVGMSRYTNKAHIARAALEATAYQTREVAEAMAQDAGVPLQALKVDGGMVGNDLLMQFQADILGVPVVRPKVAETTALGAAYAAGLAVGYWEDLGAMRRNWQMDRTWEPSMSVDQRESLFARWKRAVTRTFEWVD